VSPDAAGGRPAGRRAGVVGVAFLGLAAALVAPLAAREWRVAPGTALPTPQSALAGASHGDVVHVAAGTYHGPVVVDRAVRLVGEGWPVLDGGGAGTIVVLAAPGATLEGFRLRASGGSLEHEDAGVLVTGAGAVVRGNTLEDVLFGISVQEAPGTVVQGNAIAGKAFDIARRGDAIRVWQSEGAQVLDNHVRDSRDVVLWYSKRLTVRGNEVRNSRYGLHFMYCDDADIEHNVLRDNSVGAFLMYSRRLRFRDNSVAGNDGPSGYGIGLKDMDAFEVTGNRFLGNRVAVFVDGAPAGGGLLASNVFGAGEVGARLLPNVRGLRVVGNGFVENQQQVEIAGGGGDAAGNDWRGNFWSDYVGFDAEADGTGDVPYRADRLFEDLMDRRPELRLFTFSPAVRALDFAAHAFPLVRPQPKLEDPTPLLSPPLAAAAPPLGAAGASSLSPRGFAAGLLALAAAVIALPLTLARRHRHATRGSRGDTMNAPVSAPALLTVRGLTKRFGSQRALDDVSFTVHAGEAVALWGANGAGKTTALRALLGAIPFDGEVAIDGLDVRRRGRDARRLLGFVPQEIAFPELTAGEALTLFAGLRGATTERIGMLVERLGLAGELDKRVQTLSGGRKQRLALAVALLADPPLLLLDEPSSSLDAAARRDLQQILAGLKAEGKTLVFSSHRPEEVARLADRVLHLENGRLVGDETPAVLLAAELDEVGQRLAERLPAGATAREGGAGGAGLPAWSERATALPVTFGGAVNLHDFDPEGTSGGETDGFR
jgi:nitrous oxidase accessory protein